MNHKLRITAISGIIALIASIISTIYEFAHSYGRLHGPYIMLYVITIFLLMSSYSYFMYGFIIISIKTKNLLLRAMSFAEIIIMAISAVYSIIALQRQMSLALSIAIIGITGITEILFGVGKFRLKKKFKKLASYSAVLSVISGFLILSIVFMPLALVTSIATAVTEIVLMFRASKKFT